MPLSDRVWRERGLRDAVLAGDEQAWRTWYDDCFASLYAYVLWRCAGLRDRADEVVQETWLSAVRRLRSFDPAQGPFAGWLLGIARNLLRNSFRRNNRKERRLRPLSESDLVTPAIDTDLERREHADRIAQALSMLPTRYEEVLRAKYLDGQSVADIACARGDTPKAVESLLSRARQAFREAYLQGE
jgi:RNA polymerase sigma-70 factor (ECF subfamily)